MEPVSAPANPTILFLPSMRINVIFARRYNQTELAAEYLLANAGMVIFIQRQRKAVSIVKTTIHIYIITKQQINVYVSNTGYTMLMKEDARISVLSN